MASIIGNFVTSEGRTCVSTIMVRRAAKSVIGGTLVLIRPWVGSDTSAAWRQSPSVHPVKSPQPLLRAKQGWDTSNATTTGRVGGVVTQRIANPCTPVRFRYSPPFKNNHLADFRREPLG